MQNKYKFLHKETKKKKKKKNDLPNIPLMGPIARLVSSGLWTLA